MSNTPFDIITKYCLDHGKDFPVRNHAFAIFTQKLKDAVENHKEKNEGRITPKIEDAFLQAHLSETELKGVVAEAERNIKRLEEDLLRPYKSHSVWKEFGLSVLASFAGAFVFTALLFGLFVLAEDHIRPIVQRVLHEEVAVQNPSENPDETPTKGSTRRR